jgi:hypothetical protein
MTKAMSLVGLDVHARQTHAAVLVPETGELSVSKLRMEPVEVVGFLEGLGPGVRAVYEAGPTGFTLGEGSPRARDGSACGGTRFDPEGLGRPGQDRPS